MKQTIQPSQYTVKHDHYGHPIHNPIRAHTGPTGLCRAGGMEERQAKRTRGMMKRHHVKTIQNGRLINLEGYKTKGDAENALLVNQRNHKEWREAIAALGPSDDEIRADLFDQTQSDTIRPFLAMQAPRYTFEIERCTNGVLCIACMEAGLIRAL